MARFATLQKDIKGWRSTVDGQTHHIKNKRMVDETEGFLTLQELAQIKASNAYKNAHRLLIEAGRGRDLSTKEFGNMRDFLISKLSLDTGTRLGPLNNATLEEYFSGKVEDRCKVMLVAKHKHAKDRPAICLMLPDMYKFMEIYIRKIRPSFAKPDESALFIKDGNAYTEKTIGKTHSCFIKKMWCSPGFMHDLHRHAQANNNRDARAMQPTRAGHTEARSGQQRKKSRQWYARSDLTRTGIKAVHIIQKLLDIDKKKDKEEEANAAATKPQKDSPATFKPTSRQMLS